MYIRGRYIPELHFIVICVMLLILCLALVAPHLSLTYHYPENTVINPTSECPAGYYVVRTDTQTGTEIGCVK